MAAAYITFREPDEDGQLRYYILQRAWPHYIGEVVDNPYYNAIIKVNVPQYKFYIAFVGTLRGREFPAYQKITEEITAVLHDMAQWYFVNRLQTNPKKYSKWHLAAPPTTSL
jgi:hypothetical protein